MRNLRQNLHRSGRSNMYSKSKFSNWGMFDPYYAEADLVRYDAKPTKTLVITENMKVKVFERPLHEAFIRPFTLEDIEKTLRSIPEKFVRCVGRIILLGGTKKQEKAFGKFHFGMCCGSRVALCAYPKKRLELYYEHVPSPHVLQEYEKTSAKIDLQGKGCVIRFDEKSLKTFYLRDVLIHEIGHAVDFARRKNMAETTEEFAEWFVREYGFRYNKNAMQ